MNPGELINENPKGLLSKSMRVSCCKTSILFPFILLYEIFEENVTLYFRPFGVYVSCFTTAMLYALFLLFWITCSPCRRSCCQARAMEICFNMIPVIVFLMVVFAQWHFILTLVIAAALAAFGIMVKIFIFWDEIDRGYSERVHRKIQQKYQRFMVRTVIASCTIPCIFSVFVYGMQQPVYAADSSGTEDAEVYEAPDGGDIYEENKELLSSFTEESWQGYSINEKIVLLQDLGDLVARTLGMPSIAIQTKKLNYYTLGAYDSEESVIWLDIEVAEYSTVEETVECLCHEMFHGYQFYLINNMDWDSSLAGTAYFEELYEWKINSVDYKYTSSDGYEAYYEQPLEKSARQYAEEETELLMSYME